MVLCPHSIAELWLLWDIPDWNLGSHLTLAAAKLSLPTCPPNSSSSFPRNILDSDNYSPIPVSNEEVYKKIVEQFPFQDAELEKVNPGNSREPHTLCGH